MTSKERIIAYFNAIFNDPVEVAEYQDEDIVTMSSYLDELVKNSNNKYFLESICYLLWDNSVDIDHVNDFLEDLK